MATQVITPSDISALPGRTSPAIETGAPSLLTWLRHAWVWYRRHRLYRETVSALAALDDRVLADIGVGRHQIEDVAWAMSRKAA
jgi:uncharacterized protein YjiS (DUF1127 family)